MRKMEEEGDVEFSIYKNEDDEEFTKLPLWMGFDIYNYLKAFGAPNHDESRGRINERDETFPTDPNSAKTEFVGKMTQFSY